MTQAQERDVEILLVEDSPGDVRLMEEALRGFRLRNKLHVVPDGEEAMKFLHKESEYASAPRPDLILLDLNLPRKNGREVLREIKTDPDLGRIPTVVLTTSADERDVLESYQWHANSYVTKPVGLDQFVEALQGLGSFWLNIVTLPPDPDG